MDWTPIIVAIISGVVSAFSATLVFIGNEKARKATIEQEHRKQLKATEDNIKDLLSEHRKEYLNGIHNIDKRIDDVEANITNIQAVYQQNTAVIELKIQTLSDHVEKHNNVIERTYNLESKADLMDEKLKVANHRIDDLERRQA